jgi:hypothetical protein
VADQTTLHANFFTGRNSFVFAMTDLTIAIQHTPLHSNRCEWVRAMVSQLSAENPQIPLTIVEDSEGEGCWPTHRRALLAAGSASHHLVLQDDVGLCRDFIASVAKVIRARPGNLISLYTNTTAVFRARARREAWIEKAGICGPAMIWPKDLIREFLDWQEAHIDRAFAWDTVRVSMWLIKTSKKAFATVPSLTQHLGCGLSTLGLNGRSKVAAWYIGADRSALGIDWSQGLRSPERDSASIRPEWWQYFHE